MTKKIEEVWCEQHKCYHPVLEAGPYRIENRINADGSYQGYALTNQQLLEVQVTRDNTNIRIIVSGGKTLTENVAMAVILCDAMNQFEGESYNGGR